MYSLMHYVWMYMSNFNWESQQLDVGHISKITNGEPHMAAIDSSYTLNYHHSNNWLNE